MEELGSESPLLVKLIMKSIYKNDRREVKHIGCKRFGIQYLLKGIYSHNGLLYFHLQLKNSSNVPFEVDHLTFKIADKKVAKRTAIQEQVIRPLRAHNNVQVIRGKSSERMVFTEVHHSRRQAPRGGTLRERRRTPPDLYGRKRRSGACRGHQRIKGQIA